MERTEQMYTIQKQMDFGKIKVRADLNVELLNAGNAEKQGTEI